MKLPPIGFGTWQLADGDEAYSSVKNALETGYRLIDTAKIYGNEHSAGKAINESKVPRSEIYLTTKLWISDMGLESTHQAFSDSLTALAQEYVDLYLIHWPGKDVALRKESWQALEKIVRSGKAKSIGVSNFEVKHLKEIMKFCQIKPAVNQIELHPFVYKKQKPILEYCEKEGIAVEGYSPLAQAKNLNKNTILDIAAEHNKTPAQVMLRWGIQHHTIPLPRSSNSKRIAENLNVFDFKLTDLQMKQINRLSNNQSVLH